MALHFSKTNSPLWATIHILFDILMEARNHIRFPVQAEIDHNRITDDSLQWFVVEKLKILFLVCINVQLQHGNNNKFCRRLITR